MELDPGSVNNISDVSEDLKGKIKVFWRDSGVQNCYERRREFQISDSVK